MKHKSGLDMIMGELNAWKKVEHHNYISDLHFAFQDRSYCYFVMDLLTGADLRYYIKKRVILTEPELAFIVASMASALNHLHTRGILHRDIKPENIVFDHEGYPYLTDFGVSYLCEDGDMTCTLSSGTKQYLAPEVFCKSHEHGPESDFWSLGVMIYEIIYGKRPFEKHVNREFINHVEFETEQDRRQARGGGRTPGRGNSPNQIEGRTSPYSNGRFSPHAGAETSMSGAISLANTRTPPPSCAHKTMSPLSAFPLQSRSEQNISPRATTSRSKIAEIFASSKETNEASVRLPELSASLAASKPGSKKGKFPAMGSLAAASTMAEILRREESVRRVVPPGSASKYILPKIVAFPEIVSPDEVFQFDGLEVDDSAQLGPETDDHRSHGHGLCVQVTNFTDSNESNEAFSFHVPPLPTSLKVPIPFMTMYHEQVSAYFIEFMEGIMDIRPKYRLGGLNNYNALKNHEWFSHTELSWSDVEEKRAPPPFVPNREQIQFDMAAKNKGADVNELDSIRVTEFLSVDAQRQFDNYHHIAAEYKELFPELIPHKASPGVIPLKCRA